MTKKDKEQSKRFMDKAKELDSDESGRTFEQALKKIIPRNNRKRGDKATIKSDGSEEQES